VKILLLIFDWKWCILVLLKWREKTSKDNNIIACLVNRTVFFVLSFLLVCIQSLTPVSSSSMCEKFALRKQIARDLLGGELRVLKSASAWLNNYCATLSTSAYHREDIGDYRTSPGWKGELSDIGSSRESHEICTKVGFSK
jgi:hypothetical protein